MNPSRSDILAAYGDALTGRTFTAGRETTLPYPREVIREALIAELLKPTRPDLAAGVDVGYLELESFLPDADFEIVSTFEAAIRAQHGNPGPDSRLVAIQARYFEICRDILDRMTARAHELEQLRNR